MSQLSEFHLKHFLLTHLTCLYLIFSLFFHSSNAQASMEPVPTYITHHNWEPSVAITVAAIIFALIFMGVVSIYLRRCAEARIIIATTTTTTTVPCSCSQGINKELLNTFPTLFYSNIKDLKKGKETLECAVCLTDFTDKDTLRLLPKCNHVFHPHCIDSWLASHVTCPVCRANLTQDSCQVAITMPNDEGSGVMMEETQIETTCTNPSSNQGCLRSPMSTNDTTKIIHVNEEQQQQQQQQQHSVSVLDPNPNSKTSNRGASERKLSRSNSTGHSLVETTGKNVERYTLRLPEDVKRYIMVNHGRSVQRSASVKGLCWSDSEDSYAAKRMERWVIYTPPFVARHG